ncbi:MAG: hypothetical protein WA252_13160 [Candidatus Sulfotelmatobacter sp.]
MMKKSIAIAVISGCLSFAGGIAVAQGVHDWHEIEKVRVHVHEAIHEIEEVQAANHYQMGGHAEAAKTHLRAAEQELHLAIDAARASGQ